MEVTGQSTQREKQVHGKLGQTPRSPTARGLTPALPLTVWPWAL